MTAPECRRTPRTPRAGTCIEALAGGWINPPDLCSTCTRAFMDALDSIAGPLVWHQAYTTRSKS